MTTRSFIPLHNGGDVKDQKAPEYEIISPSKGREQFIGKKAIKGVWYVCKHVARHRALRKDDVCSSR